MELVKGLHQLFGRALTKTAFLAQVFHVVKPDFKWDSSIALRHTRLFWVHRESLRRTFINRLKWPSVTSKAPTHTVVCAAVNISHTWPSYGSALFNSADFSSGHPSTYWLLLILPYLGGMDSWVEIVCSGHWTRTSCTHEWTGVGVASNLTNWANQTDK
jgi:hypothetical protein